MAPGKPSISQKILNAAAHLSKGTTKHVNRLKVARNCGFPKGETRSYKNQITILTNHKKYLVVIDKDTIHLTDEGLKHADAEPPAVSNDDIWNQSKEQLKMKKGKLLFDLLTDGNTYTRAEVGEKIGSDHTNRSFSNILGPLKTSGFIEYVEKDGEKAVRMLDDMFPFGRPGEDGNEDSGEEGEE